MAEPTICEALVTAHEAVGRAEADRTRVIQAARRAVSLRTIAQLLGVAPSTVMRWGPLDDDQSAGTLDDPLPLALIGSAWEFPPLGVHDVVRADGPSVILKSRRNGCELRLHVDELLVHPARGVCLSSREQEADQ